MKKYDLAILSIYIIITAAICGTLYHIEHKVLDLKGKYAPIVENQAIKSVVIDNVSSDVQIFYGTDCNWKIRTYFTQHHVDCLQIKDSVLYIKDIENRDVTLKIGHEITVEIRNSPNTKILSEQELAQKRSDKNTKWRYEF